MAVPALPRVATAGCLTTILTEVTDRLAGQKEAGMSFPVPHRIRHARAGDAGELLTLQRAAFLSEAQRYGDPHLPPLRDTVDDVRKVIVGPHGLVLVAATKSDGEWGRRGRLVAAIRVRYAGEAAQVGRVVVAPDLQGRGLGSAMMQAVHEEASDQPGITRLDLFAGASSESLALYRRFGYKDCGTDVDDRGVRITLLSRPV